MELIAIRILSLGIIFLLFHNLPPRAYLEFYTCILFGHFVLQFIYSRGYLRQLSSDRNRWSVLIFALRVLLLVILGWTIIETEAVPIVVYFGLHFVLTEVYVKEFEQKDNWLKFFHVLSSSGVYLLFVKNSPTLGSFHHLWFVLIFFLGIGGLWFRGGRAAFTLVLYELVGFTASWLLPDNEIFAFPNAVFYHLLWWGVYPLLGLIRGPGWFYVCRYVCVTGLVTGVFLAYRYWDYSGFEVNIYDRAEFFGFIHVTISLLLSSSHPEWWNWLMRGRVGIFVARQ